MFKWFDSLFSLPEYAPAVFNFKEIKQRSMAQIQVSRVKEFFSRRPRPWRWHGALSFKRRKK